MSHKPRVWRQVTAYVLLVVFSLIFIIPFFWLVTTSFKTNDNINVWPPQIIPSPWTVEHYVQGLSSIPFGLYLTNTLVLCVLATLGTVLSSSLVAYGLARIPWKGANPLFWLVLSTMMLPPQVTMVPLFAVFTKLGWVDTFLPLVVPAFLGNAFFIFLLRQFFRSIPSAITEAAALDGCSEFQTYYKIILPLAKPALATVALFTFMNTWNDFLGPLIYLFDERKYTLSLGLQMFLGQYGNYFGRLMAVSTLVVVPIIALFFFTQKTFIQGITMTGIKDG